MKKILIFLAVIMFFGAFSYSIMPVIVRDRDSGKTVTLWTGEYLDVALNGNPTTGYNWYIDSKFSPVLKKISGPIFKTWSERVGAGGKVLYRLKAVKKGSTRLILAYKRAWEKVAPIKTFNFNIVVR